jgi:hypothetical protein
MKGKLLKMVRNFVFKAIPELVELTNLDLSVIESLKLAIEKEQSGKTVKCEKLILIGSLVNSKVSIKPVIKPEIILSKFSLESALNLTGTGHTACNLRFEAFETAVKFKEEK